MRNIKSIIAKREVVNNELEKLDGKIYKHYQPIIVKLFEAKDREGLEALLNEVPETFVKMSIYESLRDLKK